MAGFPSRLSFSVGLDVESPVELGVVADTVAGGAIDGRRCYDLSAQDLALLLEPLLFARIA